MDNQIRDFLSSKINPNMVSTVLSIAGSDMPSACYGHSIEKVKDYLYTIKYDDISYSFAYEHFKTNPSSIGGACSAIRNSNYVGRNFDWVYSESANFIVFTKRANGRYASMGVANGGDNLTNQNALSKIGTSDYLLLPFKMVDGINEKGVVVEVNVVPQDKGVTFGTLALEEELYKLDMLMIPRFILDNFKSANEAVTYIRDYVSVRANESVGDMNYELHFLVADGSDTYELEFVDNEAVIIDLETAGRPYVTNFFLSGVTFNSDGTVYTPETKTSSADAKKTNHITDNGDGLERWNLIVENYRGTEEK